MRRYFADSWFFIALLDRRDAHHRVATGLASVVLPEDIVTHDAVFVEVLAHFADDGAIARQSAVTSVRRSLAHFEVVAADRELFVAGLDRYAARPDKEYSHVDCISMVLMERRGIRHVLTNDHHFAQAGFVVVNQ